MDELRMIGTMLAPPDPPEDVVERGRQALVLRTSRPARRRSTRLLAGAGLTVAAAAAAVVAVVVAQSGGPTPTTTGPPPLARPSAQRSASKAPLDVRTLSGRQVLLAAATTAAAAPERTGRYWHVRHHFLSTVDPDAGVGEQWTSTDGASWARLASQPVERRTYGDGFVLAHDQLTLAQLRALPTDPAGLARFVRDSYTHTRYAVMISRDYHTGTTGPRVRVKVDPLEAYLVPSESAIQLTRLLYDLPAPAGVRAAAFGALAAMPGVRNLGPVAGGVSLRIALPPPMRGKYGAHPPAGLDRYDMVVDPATATIRSVTNYQGTDRILVAEWTDTAPPR
jgi:hypothetical protein